MHYRHNWHVVKHVFKYFLLLILLGQVQLSTLCNTNSTGFVNIVCNFSLLQMGCCGVESYRDFTGASNWPVNFPPYALQTPLACCKTLPTSSDYTCAAFGSATTSINNMYTVITVYVLNFQTLSSFSSQISVGD